MATVITKPTNEELEIYEGNYILAEFWGAKFVNTYHDGDLLAKSEVPFLGNLKDCMLKDLQYHKSWDMLKPVIRKTVSYALVYPEQIGKIKDMSIIVDIMPCWRQVVATARYIMENHDDFKK